MEREHFFFVPALKQKEELKVFLLKSPKQFNLLIILIKI